MTIIASSHTNNSFPADAEEPTMKAEIFIHNSLYDRPPTRGT